MPDEAPAPAAPVPTKPVVTAPVVRRTVDMLGGQTQADNIPGAGLRIAIELPAA